MTLTDSYNSWSCQKIEMDFQVVFFLIFKLHVTVNILSIGSIITTNTACANMPILAQIGSILNRKVKSR